MSDKTLKTDEAFGALKHLFGDLHVKRLSMHFDGPREDVIINATILAPSELSEALEFTNDYKLVALTDEERAERLGAQ